ncbi:MAG: DNA primase [Gammaproteobacteria bacterium]|nr:DNA primase [Gammaproteobacteria bacterium]
MTGRIPQDFIDGLLTRTDIVEVIDAHVPLRKAGRDYVACCPFHDEKTPSFTVSQQKQFYHCFGCGAHGTALGFLMEYEHLDFVEAVRELAGRVGLPMPEQAAPRAVASDGQDLYALLGQAADFYSRQLREHPEAPRAVAYLKERGLSGEIAAHYGIGYAPPGWDNLLRALGKGDAALQAQLAKAGMLITKEGGGYYDRFRDRVMFPIRDARGRAIGFGGRVISNEETPKYLNSPETPLFHKGRELYGLYEARKAVRDLDRLLVVEGYMDVVALAQYDIRYAVATLGTATTREHLERLFRVVPTLIFCFDGDRAGREAAWRALENTLPVLQDGRQASFLFLPDGEDPDSLVRKEGREAFESRLAGAMPCSSFFYESLLKQADVTSMDGRARLVELARPHLSQLPSGAFRQMMIARLAEIARMQAADLIRLIEQLAQKTAIKPLLTKATPLTHQEVLMSREAGSRERPQSPARMPPVRLAIALLLQRPSLALQAGDPERLGGIELPGVEMLKEMLSLIQAHPELSTGALLERWRESPQAPYLFKLARWQHPLPEQEWEAEFNGALERIAAQGIEQRKQRLLDKSSAGELSAQERGELQALFAANRH